MPAKSSKKYKKTEISTEIENKNCEENVQAPGISCGKLHSLAEPVDDKPKVSEKRISKIELKLTKAELIHIRDLMGVILPSENHETISEMLAKSENRHNVDESLWRKVYSACTDANIALEDDAPDYVVASISTPMMGIFRVQSEEELYQVQHESTEEEQEDEQQELLRGSNIIHRFEQANEGSTLPGRGRVNQKNSKRQYGHLQSDHRKK